MQLLEASKLHCIHLEQNVPSSPTFSLKEEEGREREAGVRGREEKRPLSVSLEGEWQDPWGDSKLKLRLFQAAYRMCLQM